MKGNYQIIIALVISMVAGGAQVESQIAPLPLKKAAASTELPVNAWGPYSRAHVGPCYLAQRFPGQLFSFPIVIGQKRREIVVQTETLPNGKKTLKQQEVVLRRRSLGLSPVQALLDDQSSPEEQTTGIRRARITEADADGFLWETQSKFETAGVRQKVVAFPDATGKPQPITAWGAGNATVTCFPAFAEPATDGLLIRVTLINRSDAAQSWFVDLLGGLDTLSEQFLPEDLTLQPDGDHLVMSHAKCPMVFAFATHASVISTTTTVPDTYFGSGSAMSPATSGEKTAPKSKGATEKQQDLARNATWGLTRTDDIEVDAGQTVTLWLCIGVAKEGDAAIASARTLLRLAEDSGPGHPGAYSQALAAHRTSRFTSNDATLDRLMAESLTDIPFSNWRRLGSPSREPEHGGGFYKPVEGGWIALGWSSYRPDWAATQLNAWFATRLDPETPLNPALAAPAANLFALWELYQNTGDRGLLTAFYPSVRHRYRELKAGGRVRPDEWIFAWPSTPTGTNLAATERHYAPEYSAQLIRSALILYRMAKELGRPEEELQTYLQDAQETGSALVHSLWDPDHAIFLAKPISAPSAQPAAVTNDQPRPAPVETLNGLMPLIVGADFITSEQSKALLQKLKDPDLFFSPFGLRSVSKRSAGYNSVDPDHGAIHYGDNWMLWKALLDLGEAETAGRLATNLLNGYHQAVAAQDLSPEWLDAATGRGLGANDWTGDACVLLAFFSAYHKPGMVTAGWDVALLEHRYDVATDQLRVVFCPQQTICRGVLLCVMGKPGTTYTVTGDLKQTVKSDSNGVVTLPLPDKSSTQQIQIAPVQNSGTNQ